MVMEMPSAVCIGREFVRQYYTVLNRSPQYLHRFYSQDSSFVHGGYPKQEKGCATGQQDIHWRIMQLDFRDCHAKIRQVDSHSTLGDGVVVQVTGELSNAGQPMRRFMQTFVLAPQTPLKYYVRNDIFTYQDEVFTDKEEEENYEETCEREEEEIPVEHQPSSVSPSAPPAEEQQPHEMSNGVPASPSSPQQASATPFYETQEPVRNGTSQPAEVATPLQGSAPQTAIPGCHSPGSPSETAPQQLEGAPEPSPAVSGWEEEDSQTSTTATTVASVIPTTPSSVGQQGAQEAKTYANMVSKNPAPGFTSLNQAPPAPFGGSVHLANTTTVTSSSRFSAEAPGGLPPRGEQRFGTGPRTTAGTGRSRGGVVSGGPGQTPRRTDQRDASLNQVSPPGGGGGEEGGPLPPRKPQYPDNQQVFVGNLPHFISEEQVKERFAEFGNVLEFRINAKPSVKLTGGKVVPNCGFVVFDSVEAVQKVLKYKSSFQNITIDDHRLNVEEKKTKQRLAESRGMPPFSSTGPPRGGSASLRGMGRGNGGRGGSYARGARNPSSYGARH